MPKPLAIVNALELVRAEKERREPEPEFVIKNGRPVARRLEDDHSLVDEYSGDTSDSI